MEYIPSKIKRQKVERVNNHAKQFDGDIIKAEDLQRLLAFGQDVAELCQNFQEFQIFLRPLAYDNVIQDDVIPRKAILSEFLGSMTITEEDAVPNVLAQVMQTWSFAARSDHERLLFEIPNALALLLKAISTNIGFRACGLQLCGILLQKEQVQLISRGLSANTLKSGQTSSCLWLLTEMISFDGGTCRKAIYEQREHTFKRLAFLLAVYDLGANSKNLEHECCTRTFAVRFLLANFRFQDEFVKCDLISNPRIVQALFQNLRHDSPAVVCDILDTVKKFIVLDDTIPRPVKGRLLSEGTLKSILILFKNHEEIRLGAESLHIADLAHEFLTLVCTTVGKGVLVEQKGWCSPMVLGGNKCPGTLSNQIYHHSTELHHAERVSIKNKKLATFLQALRPYACIRESDLALTILDAAPELIADYFFRKCSFPFEPRLSLAWIGYASFLCSVVRLRTTSLFFSGTDASYPPSSAILLESILPQPLKRKNITKCLNHSHNLVKLLMIEILIAAFKKLDDVLLHLRSNKRRSWRDAANSLLEQFGKRCPEMKHVVALFRNGDSKPSFLKEAVSNLLALYYVTIPRLAVQEKFDISKVLINSLEAKDIKGASSNLTGNRTLLLEHLLEVAYHSSDMRWWQKSGATRNGDLFFVETDFEFLASMSLTPFTTILRLQASDQTEENTAIRGLLRSTLFEHSVLQSKTSKSSCDALFESLKGSKRIADDFLYQFLDDCILRLIRKPIKYFGQAKAVEKVVGRSLADGQPITSLLSLVIIEQWPFFLKERSLPESELVARWVQRYLNNLIQIGEDLLMLRKFREIFLSTMNQQESCLHLEYALNGRLEESGIPPKKRHFEKKQQNFERLGDKTADDSLNQLLRFKLDKDLKPQLESEDRSELHKWKRKGVDNAIRDGDITGLIFGLSSSYGEIRLQSLQALKAFMSKLERNEWRQVFVLVGEVLESVDPSLQRDRMPWILGALAANGIIVLSNPLHFMYSKINNFLNRSPSWKIDKLPAYWINEILLQSPGIDNSYYNEANWLLDLLIQGLQSPRDVDIYRQCGVFERVLTFTASPTVPTSCTLKTLHLLYRSTFAGASTTLVTRCGVLGWIRSKFAREDGNDALLRLVEHQILRTCEQQRVLHWRTQNMGPFD